MIKILLGIVSIPIVFLALTFVNQVLPDIPGPVLSIISDTSRNLLVFNRFLPVDTFFVFTGYVLALEITAFLIKLFDSVRTSVTGAKPLFTFGRFKETIGYKDE